MTAAPGPPPTGKAPADPPSVGGLATLVCAIHRATAARDAVAVRAQATALHLPCTQEPPLPADVLARFAPADVRAHLWAQFGPPLETIAAPALCQHLLAVIADSNAGPPDAIVTAEALAALLQRHGRNRTPLHELADRTAKSLTSHARRSTDHLRELLDAPDFPDLHTISLDVLRIEGVRWVLEILGHRTALAALSEHSRRLSRLTLKQSAATIRNFIGNPDLLALFDNLAVVSQVDNLLTVATRLLDALRDGEEERTPFVTPDDEQALQGFGAVLNELATMLARIAVKAVGRRDVNPGLVVSTLEQLCFLQQFSERLGSDRPKEFVTLEQQLHRHALAIAARFEAAAAADSGEKIPAGTPHPLEAQARALANLLSAFKLDGTSAYIRAMGMVRP